MIAAPPGPYVSYVMFSRVAASAEVPLAIARSMVSFGMLAFFAVSITERREGELMSPLARRLSTAMRLPSLPHKLLFAASAAPFCRLICAHLLCPAICG